MKNRFLVFLLFFSLLLPLWGQWQHLGFIPNRGQWDASVRYVLVTKGYTVWVFPDRWVFFPARSGANALLDGNRGHTTPAPLEMKLPAAVDTILAEQPMAGRVNFFLGNDPDGWVSNLLHYRRLRCVAAGVEYELVVANGALEYRIRAEHPEHLERLLFQLPEQWKAVVLEDGTLELQYQSVPIFRHTSPRMFQLRSNDTIPVAGQFVQSGDGFRFALAQSLPDMPVLIDPLVYSTFVGTDSSDKGKAILVDNNGNAIVAGSTEDADFPTTSGAYDQTHNGDDDVFVLKLNANGSSLIFATFIGGSEGDEPGAMTQDNSGNLYLVGSTESSDFPTTSGAYDRTHNGEEDAFVVKLNSSGSALLYATYVGGSENDYGTGVAVDNNGRAVACGYTESSNFPTTNGAYDTDHNGEEDAFVLRLNPAGSNLVYSTFLGGDDDDEAHDVMLRGNGMAIVCGYTKSTDFPTTNGAYDQSHNGSRDWFVTALNSNGSQLSFSTFVGGSSSDEAYAIAPGPSNSIIVAGSTESSNFPTTSGAYDQSFNGAKDVAVVRLNHSASQLMWGTFVGGSSEEVAEDCFTTDSYVYLTGKTSSSDFPTSSNAYDQTHNGSEDVFIAQLTINGSALPYSTFLGGSQDDEGKSIVASGCAVYVTGYTYSSNFPTTSSAYDQSFNGEEDAFVVKLGIGASFTISASDQEICAGESVQLEVQPQPSGASYSWSPATGLSSTSVPNPTATPPSTITYTVTVTTPDGCSGSTSITITVSPPMQLTTSDQTICQGDTVQIGVTVSGGTSPYSYSWSPATGLSDPNVAQPDAFPQSTTVYTVTVTDAVGCSTQATVTVTVNPQPTITLSDVEVCQGDTVQIGAEAQGGTPPYSYSWSPASGLSDPNVAQPDAFPQSTTVYTVTVTDAVGCSTQATVTVTVNPQPTITLSDVEVCQGDTVQIGAEAQGGTPPYSYSWSPASGLSDPNVAQPDAFPETTTEYTVTVTDARGCSVEQTVTVTVIPQPQITTSVDALDFGALGECSPSADTTVVVTNSGQSAVTLTTVEVPSPHFSYTAPALPVSIPAGQSVTLYFRYSPQTVGTHTAPVYLRFDPCEFRDTLELSGEKTEITVALSHSAVEFPPMPECELQTVDTAVILRNSGSEPLQITSITVPTPFSLVSPASLPVTVPAYDSIVLVFRYTPTQAGRYAASVPIDFRSANCDAELQLTLRGTVTSVEVQASLDAIDFGTILGCEEARDTVIFIENQGETPISITGISSSDPAFRPVVSGSGQVAAGEQLAVTIRFSPSGSGHFQGTVQLSYEPCNGVITIPVEGNKEGVLFVAPDTVEFEKLVLCADTLATETVNLHNLSGGAISGTITDVSITPPFATSLQPGVTIAAGDSLPFTITFHATAPGHYTGELVIRLSPCDVEKRILLVGNAADAQLQAALTVVDFGTVDFGNTATAAVAVVNTGGVSLEVSEFAGLQPPFTIVSPALPVTVEPGDTLWITVALDGNQSGTFEDTLIVRSSDPCDLAVSIALQGTVGQRPNIGVAVCDRDFGVVLVGDSRDDTVCVRNTGRLSLRILQMEWVQNPDGVFQLLSNPQGTDVAPDQQQAVWVRFTPQAEQQYEGVIRVTLDTGYTTLKDPPSSIQVLEAYITVRGRGIAPGLQATGIDFDEVPIFHSKVDSIVIANTGSVAVTITGLSWSANPQSVFALDSTVPSTFILPPKSELSIPISFVPTAEQPYQGTLRIIPGSGDPVEVSISGVGVASHTIIALPQRIEVEPKDRGVRVPVALLSTQRDQRIFQMVAPVTFTATVRWDARLFHLQDVVDATVQNFEVQPDGQVEATITKTFGALDSDSLVVCELVGDILLGPADSVQMLFTAYQWGDPAVLVQPRNGEMLLTNICTQGGKRLLDFKDLFGINVSPNPSSAQAVRVTIYAVEKAASVFQVVTPSGEVVFEQRFAAEDIPEAEPGRAAQIQIQLPPILSSGTYFLRFRSPAREAVTTLLIVR